MPPTASIFPIASIACCCISIILACCSIIISFFFTYSLCQKVVNPSGFSPLISTGIYLKWSSFVMVGIAGIPLVDIIFCRLLAARAGAIPSNSGSASRILSPLLSVSSAALKMLICWRNASWSSFCACSYFRFCYKSLSIIMRMRIKT